MTLRRWLAVALAGVVAALGGCAGEIEGSDAPETTPSGAVVLQENAPSDVAGQSVVATTFDDEGATLRISDGSAPSAPTEVRSGDDVTVGGKSYRVEAIWDEGDTGEPGGQGGRVMLVPVP